MPDRFSSEPYTNRLRSVREILVDTDALPCCDNCGHSTTEELRHQLYYEMLMCPACFVDAVRTQTEEEERLAALAEECHCVLIDVDVADASRCPLHGNARPYEPEAERPLRKGVGSEGPIPTTKEEVA